MTDRSVYYRLTDAGWSRHIVPHVSRPWPNGRRPVDTAPRVGIYDNARKLAEIGEEMRALGLHTVSRSCVYHDGIRQQEQCLVDMAEDACRLGLD